MKPLILLPVILALSACATPRERCVSDATRNLQVVDRLIAQTELTLDRGYATEQYQVSRPTYRQCGFYSTRTRDGRIVRGAPRMCWDDEIITRTRPVAVNLTEQSETLASLKGKRTALAREAQATVQQCTALYPE
ncbi:hypothetical protein [Falsirhodobacter sp. alg1]|uniref:hypothetical protein n=1 Tax=Falsirhodobacter sp. alg1 TaxID=1472418 RepID=UPI0005F072BE|nr:hypothetical protein [Falsirhodobacter sp. alg1]